MTKWSFLISTQCSIQHLNLHVCRTQAACELCIILYVCIKLWVRICHGVGDPLDPFQSSQATLTRAYMDVESYYVGGLASLPKLQSS